MIVHRVAVYHERGGSATRLKRRNALVRSSCVIILRILLLMLVVCGNSLRASPPETRLDTELNRDGFTSRLMLSSSGFGTGVEALLWVDWSVHSNTPDLRGGLRSPALLVGPMTVHGMFPELDSPHARRFSSGILEPTRPLIDTSLDPARRTGAAVVIGPWLSAGAIASPHMRFFLVSRPVPSVEAFWLYGPRAEQGAPLDEPWFSRDPPPVPVSQMAISFRGTHARTVAAAMAAVSLSEEAPAGFMGIAMLSSESGRVMARLVCTGPRFLLSGGQPAGSAVSFSGHAVTSGSRLALRGSAVAAFRWHDLVSRPTVPLTVHGLIAERLAVDIVASWERSGLGLTVGTEGSMQWAPDTGDRTDSVILRPGVECRISLDRIDLSPALNLAWDSARPAAMAVDCNLAVSSAGPRSELRVELEAATDGDGTQTGFVAEVILKRESGSYRLLTEALSDSGEPEINLTFSISTVTG